MAGYSGTPLVNKLGIKSGMLLRFVNEPEGFHKLLGTIPGNCTVVESRARGVHYIHCFVTQKPRLNALLPSLLKQMHRDGMIWISWPKKASKVATDITEDVVRDMALPLGLVDVKVCAVDDVWSGLKLVIRKENR